MASENASAAERAMSFGPFHLFPRQRLLLEAGKPVPVGSRALDLLIALAERPGELLSKDELISRAWPSTHVVEGNLKFQISTLRRALHDGQEGRRYLEASPGQGYRFVANIAVETAPTSSDPPAAPEPAKHNLPPRLTPLIDRAGVIAKLADRLPKVRLLTVVGAGGIGKSSVAIAAAEQLIGAYKDGVWIVNLERVDDAAFVRSALAATVGINVRPEDPVESLVGMLASAQMLLVFDNCEHVIDSAASLAVAVMQTAPGVHILATSREPLRVEGEHLCHLPPLESPPATESLTASEALSFPTVQLFVARAAASDEEFELRDEDAPLVAETCRKLDGIPLAIELAAARVDVLGVRGVAAQLEQGLQVLAGGRRTALPRHRTMRAALDWSYGLLSPPAQTVLSRLAVFAGGFTPAAAAAVVSDTDLCEEEVIDLILELATKSLVSADAKLLEPRFRLLATTRAYARAKLKERGELGALSQRHAMNLLNFLDSVSSTDAEFDEVSDVLWLEIDNLRAALGWAFAPSGDPAIGVGLVAASVPLWVGRSMLAEWHAWAQRAVHSLHGAGLGGSRQELIILSTLGMSLQLARNSVSDAYAVLTRALELSEELSDADYQLRSLHALWIYHMRVCEVRAALALAHQAAPIAATLGSPVASLTAASMLALSLAWAGEHQSARQRLESLLQELAACPRRQFVHRAGWDLYIVARFFLARILWIQGYSDHAMQVLEESLDEARRLQNPQTLCSALAFGGCTLALQRGDLDTADQLIKELVGAAQKYGLEDFIAWGKAAQEIVLLRRSEGKPGSEQLQIALQRWRACEWHALLSISDLAAALVEGRGGDDISAVIDEELERAERHQALSMIPELLRMRGELSLLRDDPNPKLARDCFMRSIECAHAQGALSWELRAALSLALLERSQGQRREAHRQLKASYDRFIEGLDTSDLKCARRLLDERPKRRR